MIFPGVKIGKGARVVNSVVMPFAEIGEGACVDKAIVLQNCEVMPGAKVVSGDGSIVVVPEGEIFLAQTGDKQVG